MNLIDRYVAEVGRCLPKKSRADIESEIRSTLEDMLEDRSRESGKPVDDEMIVELLQEYGSPKKVADSYLPVRYLIGPRLYPFFEMVVKIVWAAATLGLLISFVISSARTGADGVQFVQSLGSFAVRIVMVLIGALGNIAIVFGILERFLPESQIDELQPETWDPGSLLAEPDPNQVSFAGLVFDVIFSIIGLVILNFYPQIVGIWLFEGETITTTSVLGKTFFFYLPWINLFSILTIGLKLYLLRKRNWTVSTRIIDAAIKIATTVLIFIMLRAGNLVEISAQTLAGTSIGPEAAAALAKIFQSGVTFGLLAACLTQAVDIARTLYRVRHSKKARAVPLAL